MTDDGRPSIRSWLGDAASLRKLAALAVLAGLILAAGTLVQGFYTPENLTHLLRQISILGIVALGQTLVLLVSGIDLSVGAVMAVSVMLVAEVTQGDGSLLPQALAIVLLAGLVVGLANGLLVTRRRVPPFAATLAMAVLIEGVRLAYTRGIPSGTIPDLLRPLGTARVGLIPVPFLLFAAVALGLWVVLSRTTFGRRVYATGMNRDVARLSGIDVDRTVMAAYIACSLLAAVAGIVLAAWVGYIDRNVGGDFTLDSIAVAAIGGTSFLGGIGGVGGTVLGAVFLMLLLDLVILLGVNVHVQLIVKAVAVLAAVAIYEARRGRVSFSLSTTWPLVQVRRRG